MKKLLILVFVIAALSLTGCDDDTQDYPVAQSPNPGAPPTISSFHPESGTGGIVVAIFGENLGPSIADNYVTFNGNYSEVVQVQTGIIMVRVPENLPQGDYTINVITRGQTVTSAKAFKVSAY